MEAGNGSSLQPHKKARAGAAAAGAAHDSDTAALLAFELAHADAGLDDFPKFLWEGQGSHGRQERRSGK